MKKLFFIFVIFAICSLFSGICKAQWVFQEAGTTEHLYNVCFINKETGWACGNYSTILKTTNGGKNWYPQTANTNWGKPLYGIYFVNENVGYIAGYYETILKTTNGGENWIVLSDGPPGQGHSYAGTFFIDANTGWIGGSEVVLKTTNAGLYWDWIPVSSIGLILFIEFFNPNTGYMSAGSSMLKSTNGGLNWVLQELPAASTLSMDFINLETGWCVGEMNNKVCKTTNGGTNWILTAELPDGNMQYSYSIKFINSNTGWIGGTYGRLYRTNNGGFNWYAEDYDIMGFVNNFSSYSDSLVWCVGGGAKIKICDLYKHRENQSGWLPCQTNSSILLKNIFAVNDSTAWASGYGDTILYTSNSGINWNGIATTGMYGILSGYFVNPLTGWVAGKEGILRKTTDGGNTWFSQYITDFWIRSIFFISFSEGWFGCDFGGVYHTTNGGLNWMPAWVLASTHLNSIYFINREKGWSCGENSYIGITTNGGQNWTQQFSPINTYFNSIFFLDENSGYCAGGQYHGGVIVKTTDGGSNWLTSFTTDYKLNTIYFVSRDTGWTAGENGTIFFTSTGGNDWIQHITGDYDNYYSIYFSSKRTGWVAGAHGTILRTTTGGEIVRLQRNQNNIPVAFHLYQNYPNPFNLSTTIKFDVPSSPLSRGVPAGRGVLTSLRVYDILGHEVQTLINRQLKPGSYEVRFDGTNLASGLYFYRIEAGPYVQTRKMLLLK
jgi:photosystem II stability/assembly factor-like uncharacterized protein